MERILGHLDQSNLRFDLVCRLWIVGSYHPIRKQGFLMLSRGHRWKSVGNRFWTWILNLLCECFCEAPSRLVVPQTRQRLGG
jgi:hypothetical protein